MYIVYYIMCLIKMYVKNCINIRVDILYFVVKILEDYIVIVNLLYLY